MEQKQTKFNKNKEMFLNKFFQLVPYSGFNEAALQKANEECSFTPNYHKILFKNGLTAVIDFFTYLIDNKVNNELDRKELDKLKIREKIHYLVMLRLKLCEPYKPALQKIVAFLGRHPAFAMNNLWKNSSKIWYEAGDEATDFNYYSKRAILSTLLATTTLYWLNDNSKEHQETAKFLTRRIEDIMQLTRVKNFIAKKI